MRHARTACLAAALAWVAAVLPAYAQVFPTPGKPIRLIVGWAPGGPTDTQARAIGSELAKALGTPVVVENKPGASGTLGALEVARAPADGHTLLYTVDGTMTQTPHLLKHLPYDPQKDFTAVSRTSLGGVVLVSYADLPIQNLKDLASYAKANPGKVSYASFGTGTVSHIYGEALARAVGAEMVHVPYKGSSDAMKDLLAGRVQIMFDSPSIVEQYASTGKLRVLGQAGEVRRPSLPEVPTLLEQGFPGFELRGWNAVFGPPNMNPETLRKVNEALRQAQHTASVTELWRKMAFEQVDESPADFAKVWQRDYQRWGAYIHKLDIHID